MSNTAQNSGGPPEIGFSMSGLAKVVDQLTLRHLEIISNDVATIPKNPDEEFVAYGLATEVLRFYLGNDWTNANVFRIHSPVPREFQEGRAFLKTEHLDLESQLRHQSRVLSLAEFLYNLQRVPGIKHRIALLRMTTLETALGELECAGIIGHTSLRLQFIVPSGIKGRDYEAEFTSPAGRTVCCEIKTKRETTKLNQATVWNTLESARKQLPKADTAGVIFLKIPECSSCQTGWREIVEAAVAKVLRQSKRVVAVVPVWDEWHRLQGNWLSLCCHHPYVNRKSPLYSRDVEESLYDKFLLSNNSDFVDFKQLAFNTVARLK